MSARTERASYVFTVKETGDGTPWLGLELRQEPGLSLLEHGFLGLTLRQGTTYAEAQRLATQLNDAVEQVSYTDLARRAG